MQLITNPSSCVSFLVFLFSELMCLPCVLSSFFFFLSIFHFPYFSFPLNFQTEHHFHLFPHIQSRISLPLRFTPILHLLHYITLGQPPQHHTIPHSKITQETQNLAFI